MISDCLQVFNAFSSVLTMLLIGCEIATVVLAEMKFVKGTYDGALGIDGQMDLLFGAIQGIRLVQNKFACAKAADCPWYTVVENIAEHARFADVGLLQVWTFDVKTSKSTCVLHCSAFYVGSNLLATAAHCVVKAGIKEPTKQLLYFTSHFDGKNEFTTEEALTALLFSTRVVTDWWIPEAYYNNLGEDPGSVKSANDIAFLKVADKKQDPGRFYTLVPAGSLVGQHAPVLLVGYPGDQADGLLRPIQHEAKIYGANDPGLQAQFVTKLDDKRLKLYQASKLLLMVATKKGAMYGGASGCPIFQAGAGNDQNRKVIGVGSFAIKQVPGGKVAKRTVAKQTTEANVSVTITEEMVAAVKLLNEGKELPPAVAKPIPAAAKQAVDVAEE